MEEATLSSAKPFEEEMRELGTTSSVAARVAAIEASSVPVLEESPVPLEMIEMQEMQAMREAAQEVVDSAIARVRFESDKRRAVRLVDAAADSPPSPALDAATVAVIAASASSEDLAEPLAVAYPALEKDEAPEQEEEGGAAETKEPRREDEDNAELWRRAWSTDTPLSRLNKHTTTLDDVVASCLLREHSTLHSTLAPVLDDDKIPPPAPADTIPLPRKVPPATPPSTPIAPTTTRVVVRHELNLQGIYDDLNKRLDDNDRLLGSIQDRSKRAILDLRQPAAERSR